MSTKIFAHRGASAYAPENTMEAFRLAYDMSADGLEIDVHLTKDGQVVVIHDHVIDRTSNGKGAVAQMTYEELLAYDFSFKFSDKYKSVKIPLLKEVLAFVKETGLLLDIEIKYSSLTEDIEEKTVALIKEYGLTDQIIISSFNHNGLYKVKELCPELATAPLYSCGLFRPWDYGKSFGADGLHPHGYTVNEELVKECHKNRMFVNVWTIDDPSDIKRFIEIGTDGIITNVPDTARKTADSL